jgi:hypothetical protein
MILGVRQALRVGQPVVLDAPAPTPPYTAVFEDDGHTGTFYAMDESLEGPQIVDAVLVYEVAAFVGEGPVLDASVDWSEDCTRVTLRLDGEVHAAFDFSRRLGASRSAWPPPDQDSGWQRAALVDDVPPAPNDTARAH